MSGEDREDVFKSLIGGLVIDAAKKAQETGEIHLKGHGSIADIFSIIHHEQAGDVRVAAGLMCKRRVIDIHEMEQELETKQGLDPLRKAIGTALLRHLQHSLENGTASMGVVCPTFDELPQVEDVKIKVDFAVPTKRCARYRAAGACDGCEGPEHTPKKREREDAD